MVFLIDLLDSIDQCPWVFKLLQPLLIIGIIFRTSRDSLEILGTVGEPINPAAWRWYYRVVGKNRCSVVDTYWQTETGGHVLTPLPGCTPQKPGSAVYIK